MCMLVYKLPNLAQAISSGQPALNGNDLSNQLKAMPTKAMRMKGAWDVASRMPGGNSARGAAGFLSNMKSIGMQAGRGDLKGAGKTALNYGKGTLGTAKNLAKMGVQNGLLDSYYKAQKEARDKQATISSLKTEKEVGNLANNTSSNLEQNAKNAHIREQLRNAISPKDNYEYELKNAKQAIEKGELPKPLNTNISHSYYPHNDHNDNNKDIDNCSNNYNNDNINNDNVD